MLRRGEFRLRALDFDVRPLEFRLMAEGEALEVGQCQAASVCSPGSVERPDGRFGRTVREDVEPRGGDAGLFVEHQHVVVQLRQFHDRLQHVLLRDAAGRRISAWDTSAIWRNRSTLARCTSVAFRAMNNERVRLLDRR